MVILFFFFAIVLLMFISLTAMGTGLAFVPFFSWAWNLLYSNVPTLSDENFELSLVTSNTTPGIFSLKLAYLTGWFFHDNKLIALLFGIVFVILFTIPSIFLIIFFMKYFKKIPHYRRIIHNFFPVIIGILVAVVIRSYIRNFLPWITFNTSQKYFDFVNPEEIQKGGVASLAFFRGWRFYLLLVWAPFSVWLAYTLQRKYKFTSLTTTFIVLALALVIFNPWLG